MANLRTTLDKFGVHARELIELLKENPSLTTMDKLFIENHLQALHMAYGTWKREVGESDNAKRGSSDQGHESR